MPLVIEYAYESDAKLPGTCTINFEPEMAFGAKKVTVVISRGMIKYRKFMKTTGSLVALFNFQSILFQITCVL